MYKVNIKTEDDPKNNSQCTAKDIYALIKILCNIAQTMDNDEFISMTIKREGSQKA